MTREGYIEHLKNTEDWYKNRELEEIVEILQKLLPGVMWMVEVSIPQLFPANKRKLGDILLQADTPIDPDNIDVSEHYILSRLPGIYLFAKRKNGNHSGFVKVASQFKSHLPVMEG